MRKDARFWVSLVVAAAALVASAVLLVDYVRPQPVFCDAEGGCGVVKRTIFAYPMGIPTPAIGLLGFLAIALLALFPGKRARIAQAVLAVFAALVAIGFIVVQFLLHTVCPYCAIADGCAIALAILSVVRAIRADDPPSGRAKIGGGVAALILAIALPLAIGFVKKPPPPELPKVIAQEIAKTPAGKITVVDFVDFECPFCRMTNTDLAPILSAQKDKIRLVRKNVPLRMHHHAMDAARAECCADRMGKGDAMADALFATPAEGLTPEGCEKLATDLGLDLEKYRACVKSAETEASIQADIESFRAAHGHGLPTIWIDKQKLEGAQDRETITAALDAAKRTL